MYPLTSYLHPMQTTLVNTRFHLLRQQPCKVVGPNKSAYIKNNKVNLRDKGNLASSPNVVALKSLNKQLFLIYIKTFKLCFITGLK